MTISPHVHAALTLAREGHHMDPRVLTTAETLLLLSLDEERGALRGGAFLSYGAAAALLVDLILVCTHDDVIEAAFDAFRTRGLKIDGGDEMKKGAYWIVEDARVQYVPPPR